MDIVNQKDLVVESLGTLKRYQSGELTPLKTGIEHYDNLLGGIYEDEIITIGARSGVGKTHLMSNIKKTFLESDKDLAVLECSWEMSNLQLVVRELAKELGKTYQEIMLKEFTDEEKEKLQKIKDRLIDDRVFVSDKSSSPEEVFKAISSFISNHPEKRKVIFFDHIALVRAKKSVKESIDWLLRSLNDIKDGKTSFILLTQLSRALDSREKEKDNMAAPQPSDIYNTDEMYHISDVVMFLHRPNNIKKYMRIQASQYPHLEPWFIAQTGDKVSLNTEGALFYHYVKVRNAPPTENRIHIDQIVPRSTPPSDLDINGHTDNLDDYEDGFFS